MTLQPHLTRLLGQFVRGAVTCSLQRKQGWTSLALAAANPTMNPERLTCFAHGQPVNETSRPSWVAAGFAFLRLPHSHHQQGIQSDKTLVGPRKCRKCRKCRKWLSIRWPCCGPSLRNTPWSKSVKIVSASKCFWLRANPFS